jgi:hypothetical protein
MKKRDWKHEYDLQKKRGDVEGFLERQKARRMYDKKKVDRKGKDIDHVIPLSKGGTNKPSNLKLKAPKDNRSFTRNSDHTVKVNKSKK